MHSQPALLKRNFLSFSETLRAFREAYPKAAFETINIENYQIFAGIELKSVDMPGRLMLLWS